jgi:glycosyltransferase involved in cell wall biosynthesis
VSLAILVPVLRRPHRVRPLLDSIAAATPEPYRVLFICDPDDAAEIAAIEEAQGKLIICAGNYAAKINMAVDLTTEPLIFLGADDLHFHEGWLGAAKAKLGPGIGVVGTNDLCSKRVMRGEHSTHSLVTREYVERGTIDEPGKLLHEGYLHEFVDDELVATAKHRGAYVHAHGSIVEHLHPMAGKAPMDELYERQRSRMRFGRRLFRLREPLWS